MSSFTFLRLSFLESSVSRPSCFAFEFLSFSALPSSSCLASHRSLVGGDFSSSFMEAHDDFVGQLLDSCRLNDEEIFTRLLSKGIEGREMMDRGYSSSTSSPGFSIRKAITVHWIKTKGHKLTRKYSIHNRLLNTYSDYGTFISIISADVCCDNSIDYSDNDERGVDDRCHLFRCHFCRYPHMWQTCLEINLII